MKNLIICFLIIISASFSIHAQFENEGKLNVWTTEKVQRNPETENTTYSVCKVRVAKHKNFDRVVFEFDDGEPQYIVQYLPSNIYSTEGGDKEIKIAGDVFMVVSIYSIGVDDPPCKLKSYPKKKLSFSALQQIQSGVWFEGIWDFLIGVKAKSRFRVQELKNPSRLVIDFKH
ncbi:MAG: hypothetical protein ABI954_08065 [Pyrinomonadaceae bacterium]